MKVADKRDKGSCRQQRQGKWQTTETGNVADKRDRDGGRQQRQGGWQTHADSNGDREGDRQRQAMGRRQTATETWREADTRRQQQNQADRDNTEVGRDSRHTERKSPVKLTG